MRWILPPLLLVLLLAGLPAGGIAQTTEAPPESPALKLERWNAEADLVEAVLEDEAPTLAEIDTLRAGLDAQRAEIPGLVAATRAELAPLRKQLEALGTAPEGPEPEAAEVAAERASLNERVTATEARLKRLELANARATALLAELSAVRRDLFSRELRTRGPSVFEAWVPGSALTSIREVSSAIWREIGENYAQSRMDVSYLVRVLLPLALIGGALFLVIGIKRAVMRRLLSPLGPEASHTRRVMIGLTVTTVRLLIPAIALGMVLLGLWRSGFVGARGETLLGGVTLATLILIGAYAFSAAYYAPHSPQLRLSRLRGPEARPAYRWVMTLAWVVALDRLLVVEGEAVGLAIEALSVLNTSLLLLGGVAMWRFSRHLRGEPEEPPEQPMQQPKAVDDQDAVQQTQSESSVRRLIEIGLLLIARGVAVTAPALAVMGYFAASRFLFYGVVLSGAVVGFCILLFHVVKDSVDRFVTPEGEAMPAEESRIRLIPVAVAFLLICAAAPVLALVWGADATDLSNAWRMISDGFHIGEVVLSPIDFVGFLLVFSIGYVLTRIVQGVLSRSVLPYSGFDAGGKAAIRAGVFYVGIFLSTLIAISATGLDLSNLAIVAGALSVGIGFGLQNIVNNFVSGIILLIERPIKAGDWVQLASGTGYVKQVNVRSTEIETFDRSSLIVPNSELISGPVTNFTHNNLNGRIIVPVGVAYGTDPRKVEAILLEIAKGHQMMLRRPAPFVLFRRFGADSLDFELRGILRDVNFLLSVTSEINFEISRRFAEAGIEIPFAQRDLHLKNAGDLGRSIAEAIRDARAAPADPAPSGDTPPEPASRRRRRRDAAGDDPDGDY